MGEFDLIAALRERLPAPPPRILVGPGDDAAVTAAGGSSAISVDATVEGVHFRRQWAPPEAIGRKALAAGLSDLAAMGAEPGEAYVVLGVPPDLDEPGCLDLLAGIEAVAGSCGAALAGGDVSRSPVLFVSVTVVGKLEEGARFVTRAGARAGELLVLTGELGGAAAGLKLLEGEIEAALADEVAAALRSRQLDPRPRLAEGRALAGAGATAMIDLSDGLGGDAGHVAAQSGVRLEIDAGQIPLQPGVEQVAAALGADPLELAAGEGEDYELLACLPEGSLDRARSAVADVGGSLTVIGSCVPGEGVRLSAPSGRELRVRGYDQLA
jgi:thiamine-monophosphate kinase